MDKKCVTCKGIKPFERFSKNRNEKDGLKKYCKDCAREMTKRYRERHREEINKRNKKWYLQTKEQKEERTAKALEEKEKVCSYCDELKPITDYYKRGNGGFYGECKDCHNHKMKAYTEKNRDKVLTRKRDYYARTRPMHLAYFKKYSRENSARNVERARLWKNNNPSKYKELQKQAFHRRAARMEELPHDFTRGEWTKCKDFFRNNDGVLECAYCGKGMKNATQDHFIPVKNGGHYTKYNIIPSCLKCNSSKAGSNFYEWYKHREYFSQERINKIQFYLDYIKRNKTIPSQAYTETVGRCND